MKEKISSLTSSTISALRFPLTVGVVFIHFNVLSDNLAVRGTGNAEHFPTSVSYTHLTLPHVARMYVQLV